MRFVRFCRSLALVAGPVVTPLVLAIPTFVEGATGCSSSSSGGGQYPDAQDGAALDQGTSADTPTFDCGPDAGFCGGPGLPPDCPVLA